MPRVVKAASGLSSDQKLAHHGASVVLGSAIRVIQHAGWYNGENSPTKFQGKYTLMGAIQFASKQEGTVDVLAQSWVLNVLRNDLKPPFKNMGDYNTAPGRTQEDVIKVLEMAMKKIDRHLGY